VSEQYRRLPEQPISIHWPNAVAERTRFFDSWLRRIAPDTHQDQAIGLHRLPVALVALPPQKNFGAAMRPLGSHNTRGCQISGTSPELARVAGDPLCCTSGTAARHPIQLGGFSPVIVTGSLHLVGIVRSFDAVVRAIELQ
jgi:hypothetical protein